MALKIRLRSGEGSGGDCGGCGCGCWLCWWTRGEQHPLLTQTPLPIQPIIQIDNSSYLPSQQGGGSGIGWVVLVLTKW